MSKAIDTIERKVRKLEREIEVYPALAGEANYTYWVNFLNVLKQEIEQEKQELLAKVKTEIEQKAKENNWYIGNAIEEHRIIKVEDVEKIIDKLLSKEEKKQ